MAMTEENQQENDALRNTYLRTLRNLRNGGRSQAELCRIFNVSRNTLRKDLAYLKGVDEQNRVDEKPTPTAVVSSKGTRGEKRPKLLGGSATQTITRGQIGSIVPPPHEFRLEDLDPEELRSMPIDELIVHLSRLSPEMARGLFDFLRMANPGYDINAYQFGSELQHEAGQEAIALFEQQLAYRNGSPNVVYNKILTNTWIRGALLAELVLDSKGRVPIDIAVPDAGSIRFRITEDPDLGRRWEMVQRQDGEWVNIERETVKWAAHDPLPGTPYGTPLVSPDVFPAVFLLTVLQDMQRVIAQQGWPRYDIAIDVPAIVAMLGDDYADDPELIKQIMDAAVAEVTSAYDRLEPTSAYVHASTITVNKPIGAMAELPFISDVVELLERMNVRALKTMPILFGMTDNTSEANANRQWEIHTASVQALQKLAETSLSEIFTLMLQAQGIDAVAAFKFHELRSSEEKREAETEEVKIRNYQQKVTLLVETPTQASIKAFGHELPEGVTDEQALEAAKELGKPAPPGGVQPNEGKETDEPNAGSGETGDGKELETSDS